ncbi:MAG: hypothetical protein GY830_04085 [Bacteroidetes bacterium]|nr:hypothetical protein [Bacteroidota bacterium]
MNLFTFIKLRNYLLLYFSLIIFNCNSYVSGDDNNKSKLKKIEEFNLNQKEKIVSKIENDGKVINEDNNEKSLQNINRKDKAKIEPKYDQKKSSNTQKIKYTYLDPLKNSQRVFTINQGKNIESNYKNLCTILENCNSKYLLKIGQEKYIMLKEKYEDKTTLNYVINNKTKDKKFLLVTNSNEKLNNEIVLNRLKVNEEFEYIKPKYFPLMQKHKVGQSEDLIILKEFIEGKPLKLKFKFNEKSYLDLKLFLFKFLKFLNTLSEKQIIMKNLNLNNIILNKSKNIKIAGGEIEEIGKNTKEECLRRNIENLDLIWFWYSKISKFKNLRVFISRRKIKSLGKMKTEEEINEEKKNMPIKMSKPQILIFHAFIKSLLKMHSNPYYYLKRKSITNLKNTYIYMLKTIRRRNR